MRYRLEYMAFHAYVGASFVSMFAGAGPGRALLLVSLLLLAGHLIRERRLPDIPVTGWWAIAYLVWITAALFWGPLESLQSNHFYRNLVWLNIPVGAMLLVTPERRRRFFAALALGTVVLSLRVLGSVLVTVWTAYREGLGVDVEGWVTRVFLHRQLDGTDIIGRLVVQGGMQDGQRLAIGLIVLAACPLLWPRWGAMKGARLSTCVLAGLAFAASFKRGPWLALLLIYLGVALHRLASLSVLGPLRNRTVGAVIAAGILAVAAGLLSGEGGRSRIEAASDWIDTAAVGGGRVCMWFEVTPELARAHPFGIGFRALSNEMMRETAPHVERGQTHVHSNLLQSLIDGGWIGLLLFIGWMISAFRDLWRYRRQSPAGSADHTMARSLFLMLATLVGMGLVEYQLGSAQMVLVYGALMGCAAAGARGAGNPEE